MPQQRRQLSIAAAARAVGKGKRSRKAEEEPRQCPCGSGLRFHECCGPIVGGAWARTAPELARARFTALVLNKPSMLAETTHPEAIAAIGTKHHLLKRAERLVRQRGAGGMNVVLVDSVHGQSPDDPDVWIVLLAIAMGEAGMEKVYWLPEHYRKDGGRWWFLEIPAELAIQPQFQAFLDRYGDPEDSLDPLYGKYEYSWIPLPPRALSAVAAAKRPQWLSDDWPEEQKPSGWVYLDTALDPETGLTAAQTAAHLQQAMNRPLRDPKLDWEAFYFRHGRFME